MRRSTQDRSALIPATGWTRRRTMATAEPEQVPGRPDHQQPTAIEDQHAKDDPEVEVAHHGQLHRLVLRDADGSVNESPAAVEVRPVGASRQLDGVFALPLTNGT